MKRVFIALLLCFIFSSEIQAKKGTITSTQDGDYVTVETTDSCFYSISAAYGASVHAHKSNLLVLNALVGDKVTPLSYKFFPETRNWGASARFGTWEANSGDIWSLVWVFESTKGKGHVIDAVEMASGICNP